MNTRDLLRVSAFPAMRAHFQQTHGELRFISQRSELSYQKLPSVPLQSRVRFYTDSREKVWEGCGRMGKGLEGPKSHDRTSAICYESQHSLACPLTSSGLIRNCGCSSAPSPTATRASTSRSRCRSRRCSWNARRCSDGRRGGAEMGVFI